VYPFNLFKSSIDTSTQDEQFESVAESLGELLDPREIELTDIDDSELCGDTSSDSDKPAISEDDLELVEISSDEDVEDEFEDVRLERLRQHQQDEKIRRYSPLETLGGKYSPADPGAIPFLVDNFFDWKRSDHAEVVEQSSVAAPVLAKKENTSQHSQDEPGDDFDNEDDEFEIRRLLRLREGGRGRCERSAPERDVVEDDTETAEFQSRLRKLSNPGPIHKSSLSGSVSYEAAPSEQQQTASGGNQSESDTTDHVIDKLCRQSRSSVAPERELEQEDTDTADLQTSLRRSKSHDIFQKRRKSSKPGPSGRRGSWHLESVDEHAPLFSAEVVDEEEEEEEDEKEEEEEDVHRKEEEGDKEKENKPNSDNQKGASPSSSPRLFRYVVLY
jgi:hypothetical protein